MFKERLQWCYLHLEIVILLLTGLLFDSLLVFRTLYTAESVLAVLTKKIFKKWEMV